MDQKILEYKELTRRFDKEQFLGCVMLIFYAFFCVSSIMTLIYMIAYAPAPFKIAGIFAGICGIYIGVIAVYETGKTLDENILNFRKNYG